MPVRLEHLHACPHTWLTALHLPLSESRFPHSSFACDLSRRRTKASLYNVRTCNLSCSFRAVILKRSVPRTASGSRTTGEAALLSTTPEAMRARWRTARRCSQVRQEHMAKSPTAWLSVQAHPDAIGASSTDRLRGHPEMPVRSAGRPRTDDVALRSLPTHTLRSHSRYPLSQRFYLSTLTQGPSRDGIGVPTFGASSGCAQCAQSFQPTPRFCKLVMWLDSSWPPRSIHSTCADFNLTGAVHKGHRCRRGHGRGQRSASYVPPEN